MSKSVIATGSEIGDSAGDTVVVSEKRRRRGPVLRLLLALLLSGGIVARLAGAWIYRYSRNPDYAVVVQMARNIASGRDWPVFFYGQAYMGSLEPTVSALCVKLFGPDPFVVCLGTALVAILLILVATRWAYELGGMVAALVTAALLAIGPTGYFHYMASPRGGYALALVLTLLLLRAGSRLAWQGRHQPVVSLAGCFALGLWGGLGFWNFWLTLPALAAAGLLLLASLRGRILRIRVWLPGALGFLLGSLPFWFWNLRHAWPSLNADESTAGRGQPLQALLELLLERVPRLLDISGASAGKMALVLLPHIILLGLGLVLLWPRRRTRWSPGSWALAAILLWGVFFGMAYALSSFSIPQTSRYLLPLLPLFALLAGQAVSRLSGGEIPHQPTRQTPPAAIRHPLLPLVVLSVVLILLQHAASLKQHQESRDWYDVANELTGVLEQRGADGAFADYLLYGFNWATDEDFCFSSPILERYQPFAEKLELAQNPAVLENFRGFDNFLLATGASATFEYYGNLRIHSNAQQPGGSVRTLPQSAISSIRDSRGRDVTGLLTDCFASTLITCVPHEDEPAMIEIEFNEPVSVCGLRFLMPGSRAIGLQSVAGRAAGEEEFKEIIAPHVPTHFLWSGERFYFDAHDLFEEKRFAERELTALRLYFDEYQGADLVRISELVVLQPDGPAQLPDVAAIAAALRQHGITRVHAGRWLANQLQKELEGTAWVSCNPKVYKFTPEECLVIPQKGTAIVTDAVGITSVRQSLQLLEIDAEELVIGSNLLVLIGETSPGVAAYHGLEFSGGLLIHAYRYALADFWFEQAVAESDTATRQSLLQRALEVEPRHARAQSELRRMQQEWAAVPLQHQMDWHNGMIVPVNAAFFNEGLILESLLDWNISGQPGDEIGFVAEWSLAPGFRPPVGSGLCLHFVRDGQIQFQVDEPLVFRLHHFNQTEEIHYQTYHIIRIPHDAAPGEYQPLLGVFRPGLLSTRVRIETDLPLRRRRIELPTGSFIVEP